jgi:hypothetical protein
MRRSDGVVLSDAVRVQEAEVETVVRQEAGVLPKADSLGVVLAESLLIHVSARRGSAHPAAGAAQDTEEGVDRVLGGPLLTVRSREGCRGLQW